MSNIVNRPSEAVQHEPHEDVAAEVCTDASMLTDRGLEAVSGGMDLKGASEALTQRAQQCAVDLKGASDALTNRS
jgi:hypothetical protein